ncbi:MAG: hypothetical protein IH939_13795 [Acidobacteria bacterium]|nr:hypothetical protein [Acidobacteriota bacterium]
MPGIRIGPSGFVAAAEWTRERLDLFGVPQPPGNRLIKAEQLIRDVNDRRFVLRPDDDTLLYRVSEAQWTIVEQYIIARSLGKPGSALGGELRAKLATMLSGAGTEDDDKNPLARNTQFELYTRATIVMGNVPAWLAEPDLRVDYLGAEIGVAAKRVTSSKQLLKRAKDAVRQIKKSGLAGFVALNVDVLMKAVAPDVTNDEPLHERLALLTAVDDELVQHDEVVGSLVFARDTVWQFGDERPSVGIASTQRFATYPRSPEQLEHGELFWRKAQELIDQRLDEL